MPSILMKHTEEPQQTPQPSQSSQQPQESVTKFDSKEPIEHLIPSTKQKRRHKKPLPTPTKNRNLAKQLADEVYDIVNIDTNRLTADDTTSPTSSAASANSIASCSLRPPTAAKPKHSLARNPDTPHRGSYTDDEKRKRISCLKKCQPDLVQEPKDEFNSISEVKCNAAELSIAQINCCLKHLNLGQYCKGFSLNSIDGQLLESLQDKKEMTQLMSEFFDMKEFEAHRLWMFVHKGWRPK